MRVRCPCLPIERWQTPDKDLWTSARGPSRTVLDRRGPCAASEAYWKILKEAYGCFLGWLLAAGLLDWTVAPTHRCSIERLEAYIEFMLARVRPATAQQRVEHLRVALTILGELPDARMFTAASRRLRRLALRARRFERPPPPARLKALGMKLMALAESASDLRARVNAVIFRDGLFIAALAYRPLRCRNWAELRIGYDLVHSGGRWWIVPKRRKVKNRKGGPIAWPMELMPALERYLDVYRPLLIADESSQTDALWVTYRRRATTPNTLSLAVGRRTEAEFGRAWRPHAFRRSAAGVATVDDAATLLGDTHAVVQQSYAPADRSAALRKHMQMLQALQN